MGSVSNDHLGDGLDDLARQRRKRADRLLGSRARLVSDATVRDLVVAAIAAIEESGGRVDVRRYLLSRGCDPVVIDEVVAHLDAGHAHPSCPSFDGGAPR